MYMKPLEGKVTLIAGRRSMLSYQSGNLLVSLIHQSMVMAIP